MKIYNMLDFDLMKKIMTSPFEDFESMGKVVRHGDRRHIFIDNGADVLAIAHLDSVENHDHFYRLTFDGKEIVFASTCDDRLGAYILIDLLPQLGIHYDLLLTDMEEIGKSTASDFEPEKTYNWMFQFDRMGNDAVNYMYTEPAWTKALGKYFKVNRGSCSDISYLEHLECSGVNVGCGYFDPHSTMAYFDVQMMVEQVGQFAQFYHANKRTHFPHSLPKWKTTTPAPSSTTTPYTTAPFSSQVPMPLNYKKKCVACETEGYYLDEMTTGESICKDCARAFELKKCKCCLNFSLPEELQLVVVFSDEEPELWCSTCVSDMNFKIKESSCLFCDTGDPDSGRVWIGVCEACERTKNISYCWACETLKIAPPDWDPAEELAAEFICGECREEFGRDTYALKLP